MLAGALLGTTPALAQNKPACDESRAPQKLEGRVVKVDVEKGKVTVRAPDGTNHEFQASKETLQDLKAGDRIEAKLRSAPNC
jgi:Cu/Ag efflux protein CusF